VVIFDGKRTFIVPVPIGVSGCEEDVYRVDFGEGRIVYETCYDGERAIHFIPIDSLDGIAILSKLAEESGDVRAKALAVAAGASPYDLFQPEEVRYVVRFDSIGGLHLDAVELRGKNGWVRYERGESQLADAIIENFEAELQSRTELARRMAHV